MADFSSCATLLGSNRKKWVGACMSESDQRRDKRVKFRADVKVTHPEVGEVSVHTDNISDTGAFILSEGHPMPGVGEVVEVQIQGMGGDDAPKVTMRITRIDADGIGLEFLE